MKDNSYALANFILNCPGYLLIIWSKKYKLPLVKLRLLMIHDIEMPSTVEVSKMLLRIIDSC